MSEHVKKILEFILKKHEPWHTIVLKEWATIVGDLHTRMRLEKIEKSTLIVGVYDSHWMHELHILSSVIIDTINSYLGNRYIKAIRFKLITPHKPIIETKNHKTVTKKNISLTYREEHALKNINDPELQEALKQYLLRCKSS